MKFTPTVVDGAFVVALEPHGDDRGSFARAFAVEEFAAHGIPMQVVHANLTHTRHRGTVRGLHYQVAPAREAKLFRCISGGIFQVAADVRRDSPTFGRWVGVELTAANRLALYAPEGCAAGAQALTDDAEALYLVSAAYSPEHERGLRWDDPTFAIAWPLPAAHISDKDLAWPPFTTTSEDRT
jgi:dTDP-4-dehydrorhamnose 3,5-epimerase